jgi:acyl dehydratase
MQLEVSPIRAGYSASVFDRMQKETLVPPLVAENLDSLKGFVGREIATTDWFTVTQDRIQQFAETTEDRQWIHLDQARAQRESPPSPMVF